MAFKIVYNQTITPKPKRSREFLILWLAPVLALLAVLGVWYSHFDSSFHVDDEHTVVHNGASLGNLDNVSRFFYDPDLSADEPAYVYYQPLLTTTLALDYRAARNTSAFVYQIDTFAWFLLDLIAMYLAFTLFTGSNRRTALLGAAIFALHPVTADTVNYVSRRGSVMGAFGLLLGLYIWIFWAKHLPRQLLRFTAVPKTRWDLFRRVWYPRFNSWYKTFTKLPLALYLIPVALALLADPNAAVFAPILLAYMLLFDFKRVARRIAPAAIVCTGYGIFHLLFTWRFATGHIDAETPLPFFSYLIAQPLVIVRYFFTFFIPVHLSAASGVNALPNFWSPPAVAGYVGLAGIVWLAVATARRPAWRSISFGIWWFLIALLPTSLVPQSSFEDDQRMYLPMVGLAFASARGIWMLAERIARLPVNRKVSLAAQGALIFLLLAGGGWLTFERNQVWNSEATLWADAARNSPRNPTALIRHALLQAEDGDTLSAYENLVKAATLASDDPASEITLARAFDSVNKNADAEQQFRRAVASGERYSPAFSSYAQWLSIQGRMDEALKFAARAIAIDARNLAARHVMMEVYSAKSDWNEVNRMAGETLDLEPGDAASLRARELAESVFDRVKTAERDAESGKTVNDYLHLSVAYFQNRQYEDSVKACQHALAVHPELAEAYSNMAAAYYALGRLDESETALREVIRIRPEMATAKNNLDFVLALKSPVKTVSR
jgi:tetratricopeptide (TPR) repeat protein